ncbi:penicillin-insensitive murein endopeptidase [Azospirillum sp. SYSU D00513]|uniref:penicillin-insensitive murein endopeptidase n=1 Tax=Azospirillum sp. SYSU D00513 TaxID=2812561 RepID=UPI001A96C3D3|nr:penicillin-insensitive murein endopeptidase [Azospirillum sp. SYSU D00513]
MRRLTAGFWGGLLVAVGLLAGGAGEALAGSAGKKPSSPQPDPIAWSQVRGPSGGIAQSIGGYAAGCVAGARPLAPEGTGYQLIRLSRKRNYGHPALIDFLEDFGRKVAAARIGTALIGDMGQARGGPMSFGHASHQNGLDADVWLRLDLPALRRDARETLREIKYVDYGRRRVSADWSEGQAQMIRIAAADPRVARIFINPAIKQAMCRHSWPDRSFLRKLRPWHGHDGHMHIRLSCPPGSPQCEEQKELPAGEGCGEDVESWMASLAPLIERPPGDRPRPRAVNLPPVCRSVLRASGTTVASAGDGLSD